MSEWLSTKEVADMLGVSPAALECRRCENYKKRANGEMHPFATLPYYKIANSVKYKKRDVLELLERLKVAN